MPHSSRHEFDVPVQFVAELNPIRIITDKTDELSPGLREAILKVISGISDAQKSGVFRPAIAIEFTPIRMILPLSSWAVATIAQETSDFLNLQSLQPGYRIHTTSIDINSSTSSLIITWEFFFQNATVPSCHTECSVIDKGGEESNMMDERPVQKQLITPQKPTPEELEEMDLHRAFLSNRPRFDGGFMEQFSGEFVAWNADGTRVVAHDPSDEILYDKIRNSGMKLGQCKIEYVPSEHDDI